MMLKVLAIASRGVEEIELYTVCDILVRSGATVTVAGLDELHFKGSRGLPVASDTFLKDCMTDTFDLLYIPGGMEQAKRMTSDPTVQTAIKEHFTNEKPVAIICASPLSLIPQNLASDKIITSYPSVKNDLKDHVKEWRDQRIVQDGNLFTSQGPGTAMEFGLYLIEQLISKEKRDEVAQGLLFKS